MNVTDVNLVNKRQRKRNNKTVKNNINNVTANKRRNNNYANRIDILSKTSNIKQIINKLSNNKGKIMFYGCLFFFGTMLLFTIIAGLLLKLLFFIANF